MTLDQLSAITGVPKSTLGDLETGRNAMPSDESLIAICDGLGIPPGMLWDLARK